MVRHRERGRRREPRQPHHRPLLLIFSAVLIVAWMWALSFIDSRSDRVLGTGSQEYIRVV